MIITKHNVRGSTSSSVTGVSGLATSSNVASEPAWLFIPIFLIFHSPKESLVSIESGSCGHLNYHSTTYGKLDNWRSHKTPLGVSNRTVQRNTITLEKECTNIRDAENFQVQFSEFFYFPLLIKLFLFWIHTCIKLEVLCTVSPCGNILKKLTSGKNGSKTP